MTDEIKKAFESAKTDEEKRAVLEKYKDTIKTISEDELNDVTGGCGFVGGMVVCGEDVAHISSIARP